MQADSASSIGPPMLKNACLTPCPFRHRPRISLPVMSAIWGVSSSRWSSRRKPGSIDPRAPEAADTGPGLRRDTRPKMRAAPWGAAPFVSLLAEDVLGAQLLDVAAVQAKPADEHLLGVLAELWRWPQFGRPPVEAHRPSLADPVAVRVVHRLHDA